MLAMMSATERLRYAQVTCWSLEHQPQRDKAQEAWNRAADELLDAAQAKP